MGCLNLDHRPHPELGARPRASGTGLRVLITTAAYVFVQAVFFGVKFVIYDKWVFAGKSRVRAALRSRHQVWSAARANRTP